MESSKCTGHPLYICISHLSCPRATAIPNTTSLSIPTSSACLSWRLTMEFPLWSVYRFKMPRINLFSRLKEIHDNL